MAPGPINNTAAICFTVDPKSRWRSSQGAEETQNLPQLSGPDATGDIWGLTVLFSIRDTFLWPCPPQIYISAAGQRARIHTVLVFGRGGSLIADKTDVRTGCFDMQIAKAS